MTEKINSPKETICLMLTNKIMNVGEINKILYPKFRNPKVSTYIGELLEKNWIKEVKVPDSDRREKYYTATNQALLDSIKQRVTLELIEENKLKEFFSCDPFLTFLMQFIVKKPRSDFKIVLDSLSIYSVYNIIFLDYIKDKFAVNTKDARMIWSKMKPVITKSLNQTVKKSEEDFVFSFIGLGNDVLQKLSSLNENNDTLLYLGKTLIDVFNKVDSVFKQTKKQG